MSKNLPTPDIPSVPQHSITFWSRSSLRDGLRRKALTVNLKRFEIQVGALTGGDGQW
jgi:hypothetical protein